MKTLLRYRNWLWALLQSFGPWGVFLMAGLDGAGVPLPGALDAVVVTYVYQKPLNAWLYVLLASAGSALGCLVLYLIGYVGGEVVIERRMSPEKFERIRSDFEEHPVLTLALPAILPPPFPFKIFVLSAGAFEMRWSHFVVVIFLGRLVRFAIFSLLTIAFGPEIITLFSDAFRKHPAITVMAIVMAVVIVLLARKLRRHAAAQTAE